MIKKLGIFIVLCVLSNTLLAANNSAEKQRLFMLEHAIAPNDSESVAKLWAEAIKNRNGAVQYMLLCSDQQKTNEPILEKLNWVTGVSSPSVASYKISKADQPGKFDITYQLAMSGKDIGKNSDQIQVIRPAANGRSSQQWCISQFKLLSPTSIQPKS